MHELETSNHLLGDRVTLQDTMEKQGYLFFREVIDVSLVDNLKRGVMAWFEANGYINVVDDEPIHTGVDVGVVGEHPAALYDTHLWESFSFMPPVRPVYDQAFGERAHILPMGEYQFTWPGRVDCWTRIHQDGPYNPGVDFWVFWIPLMDIDEDLGGLAIAPTEQSTGSLHPDVGEGPDASLLPFIPADTLPADPWYRADYRRGDVLVFGPYTPHCGMPNSTDKLRFSIDIRVQPARAKRPITGVVTGAPPGGIVIAAETGEQISLTVDENTAMPLMEPRQLLGRRVLAAEDGGRATLVRNQRGHVPFLQ